MLKLIYAPHFVRQFKRLPTELQVEVVEKLELLKHTNNHTSLKVHKLHGRFSGCLSFSVNFKIRIIFEYNSKKEMAILTIGDHEVYK